MINKSFTKLNTNLHAMNIEERSRSTKRQKKGVASTKNGTMQKIDLIQDIAGRNVIRETS